MAGFVAKFRIDSAEKGYLLLVGEDMKERVETADEATIFTTSNEAVIKASTELDAGETVEPIERL